MLKYDYVIDAIDDVNAKIAIIKYCNENNIKIISALGAGNRIVCPNFKVCDIFKTENDGLAKRLRKELRNLNIKKLNVCFCDILPLKVNGFIGSISYYPAMSGCTIASFVISELIK
jgi:tRNA A37 threonylcarbamoyladenosine dehydratase